MQYGITDKDLHQSNIKKVFFFNIAKTWHPIFVGKKLEVIKIWQ